jgi:hypothetical protein
MLRIGWFTENNILIGSGMSPFHNLRIMFSGGDNNPDFKARHVQWSDTLTNAIQIEKSEERGKKLET